MDCKKATLLSLHPETSYELVGNGIIEDLLINDKSAFWDKSDFLIIEIVEAK